MRTAVSSRFIATALYTALMLGLTVPANAQEGGIEVFSGETLFGGGYRVSTTLIMTRKEDLFRGSGTVHDPAKTRFDERLAVIGLDYGLRANLTATLLVPIVERDLRFRAGSGRTHFRASGLGDISLLGKFRFLERNWPRSSFNSSLLVGIVTPTGETQDSKNGVRLPVGVQLGRGAWNPFVASATTLSLDKFRYDLTAKFRVNTEGAQDYEQGNEAQIRLAAAYRFLFRRYPGPTAAAQLAIEWRHESRARQSGSSLHDSGADETVLIFGLGTHPIPAADISLRFEVPVAQHYNGQQLGLSWKAVVAIGLRF